MGVISNVDMQTRLDVLELASRYCHLIDHDAGQAWAELFTMDGVLEIEDIIRLTGREQLATVPGSIREKGDGKWRHQMTNIIIDRTDDPRGLIVKAYCLVTGWQDGGSLIAFSDYQITLRKTCHWQIVRLFAKPLSSACREASPLLESTFA